MMFEYKGKVMGDLSLHEGAKVLVEAKVVGWSAGVRKKICRIIVGDPNIMGIRVGSVGDHPLRQTFFQFVLDAPCDSRVGELASVELAEKLVESIRFVFRPYKVDEGLFECVAIVKFCDSGNTIEVPLWGNASNGGVKLHWLHEKLFVFKKGSESDVSYKQATDFIRIPELEPAF